MRYFNSKGDEMFTIHTPGRTSELIFRRKYTYDLMRKRIEFDTNKISLISPMNAPYWEKSDLRAQCEMNNIPIYNAAMEETDWVNVKKLNYIYDSLLQVDTDYCLVMDGADAWLCNEYYGDNLIERFNKFNAPIVYNGDVFQYPLVDIEGLEYRKQNPQLNKYLNAGICFGKTEDLLKVYKEGIEISDGLKFNRDEQFVVRLLRNKYPKTLAVDRDNDLFILYHEQANVLEREGIDKIIMRK